MTLSPRLFDLDDLLFALRRAASPVRSRLHAPSRRVEGLVGDGTQGTRSFP